MAEPLNVIALISGGKDSFFSLLHCLGNGHRVIALANLYPSSRPEQQEFLAAICESQRTSDQAYQQVNSDDIDSFMYQTVGHTLIPLYADALGLPLYRQAITGGAQNSSKYYYYEARSQDNSNSVEDHEETECLLPLLEKIMAVHPEANAVCSGAILSTYQRTRIESIAIRLSLIPLSFLWQYPTLPPPAPQRLLEDMAEVGFDVRIVKVASGGLDQSILWSNIMDTVTRETIERAVRRFGGSMLGEGGEYETIVIDGPSPLWKSRICLDRTKMRIHVEDGGQASFVFAPGAGRLLAKRRENPHGWRNGLRTLPLWDAEFQKLRTDFPKDLKANATAANVVHDSPSTTDERYAKWPTAVAESRIGSLLYISNLISPTAKADTREQMAAINEQISEYLNSIGHHSQDIVFTTIILRSISQDFVDVNEIYGQLFSAPNPPARVTVASRLPQGVNVMVSIVVDLDSDHCRDGLHVQSRSYWAPANIGPYSQAIRTQLDPFCSTVHVAGQIPLVPATMEPLHPETRPAENDTTEDRLLSFHQDSCLSLQHLWRIGRQMNVSWWAGTVAFITSRANTVLKARIVCDIWSRVHDRKLWQTDAEESDINDVWDKTYGNLKHLAHEAEDAATLPDFRRLTYKGSGAPAPGLLIVEAVELPRKCEIEWQSLGVSQANVNLEVTSFGGIKAKRCEIPCANQAISYVYFPKPQPGEDPSRIVEAIEDVRTHIRASTCMTTVYSPDAIYLAELDAQVVPCKALWGLTGVKLEELAAGIVLHSESKQGG